MTKITGAEFATAFANGLKINDKEIETVDFIVADEVLAILTVAKEALEDIKIKIKLADMRVETNEVTIFRINEIVRETLAKMGKMERGRHEGILEVSTMREKKQLCC